jgi:hypothetical protein
VPPSALHRFLGAYTRYLVHLFAYIQLVGNPFPGFVGKPGSYPLDVEIEGPERQNRWVTAFRGVLVFPAVLIAGALAGAAFTAALLSWWYAMFRGRVPRGLRNLGAYELRYYAQYMGYALFLTDRYPWSGPQAGWQMTLAPATPAQA